MRLLVIGGTGVIGRAVIEVALARGFAVTNVSRGESGEARAPVQNVFVDRSDDERFRAQLTRCRPDIVIDCIAASTEDIAQVTSTLPAIHSHVAVWRGDDALTPEASSASLIASVPVVMGPGDIGGALPSWLQRLGDEFVSIVPAELEQKVDCIDARDLAVALLDAATRKRSGSVRIRRSDTVELADIIGGCTNAIASSGGSAAEVLPISSAVLVECGVTVAELPLWNPQVAPGTEVGLPVWEAQSRPVEQTIADTLAWLRGSEYFVPLPDDGGPGFTAARFEYITSAVNRLAEPPAVVSLLQARAARPAK